MTIIEFYDKASIENIAGALLCAPERMVLIGDDKKTMARALENYRVILEKNNITTQLSCISVNKYDFKATVSALSKIAEEYDDCVFDLTGGDEMYLVAVGYIMCLYKDKVQCHRFNIRNGNLVDCDNDGRVADVHSFKISIEDNIRAYGGELVTDPKREIHTYPWVFNQYFDKDIDVMWNICRQNPRRWNSHVGTLARACDMFRGEDPLEVCFEREAVAAALKAEGYRFVCVYGIMNELQKNGLISSLVMDEWISFKFKNEQVKQSLTIAGQILELAVAKKLRKLKDKKGDPFFDEIKVGVVIDWDGEDWSDECRTVNEIDIIAMKGLVPVYISCKNGEFDSNELYKLNTVAERFGGKYAKKVLVSTEIDALGRTSEYIRARMKDMNIRSIDNVDEMPDDAFEKELKNIL